MSSARSAIKQLELTLAIIKPHVIANTVSLNEVRHMIIENEFKIVRTKRKRLPIIEAEEFYKEHKGKFFFNRLVTFMTSGPIDLHILARENSIKHWRSLMGPTKVYKAQFSDPDTIRGKYGLSDTRNATHGSDSEETARKEIKFFFPDFDYDEFYSSTEPLFRSNHLELNENEFVHKILK